MKHEAVIEELQGIAAQLGVTIRYDKGDFEGGYCVLKDEKILVVNKRLLPARKAAVLALALHEVGLESLFIKPALREYIEDEVAKTANSETHPAGGTPPR